MINKGWLSLGWQSQLAASLAGMGAIFTQCSDRSLAQVVPDATLGAENSVVTSNNINNLPSDVIDGGAIRGANLFHSFEQFNIGEGRGAYFNNPAGIARIFGRVTGGNASEILGTLGVLGNADLFLINPKGITFGPNASLNVNGSFVASTANAIKFGDRSFFSASTPQNSNLLSIQPSALFFNALANGSIVNRAQSPSLSGQTNFFGNSVGLQVPQQQTLALVGGELILDGGNLTALGGRIELGSVAPSSLVSLSQQGTGWVLGYEGATAFEDVQLFGGATVDSSHGGSIQVRGGAIALTEAAKIVSNTRDRAGGAINIFASQLQIQKQAAISASTFGSASAGNLFISADNIELVGDGGREFLKTLLEGTFSPLNISNGLFTVSFAQGAAGNLTLNTGNLVLKDGAEVSSSTYAQGVGGSINIRAASSVQIIKSLLFAGTQGAGNGGDLNIDTRNLLVQDLGTVTTDPFATGNGGNLTINASESVEVNGSATDDPFYVTGIFSNSLPFPEILDAGDSGDLTINTRQLIVKDGGEIGAGTFGNGQGGNLTINASESVEVIGVSPDLFRFPSNVYADTFGAGNIGKLTVSTKRLSVRDGGQISATTFAEGQGGNLVVNATESIEITGSSPIGIDRESNELFYFVDGKFPSGLISSSSAAGKAGNLLITAGKLAIRDGAQVTASSTGLGTAGNINLKVEGSLQVNNSTISTAAVQSSGGAIAISAADIRLVGDSDITTDVFSGVGGGGNISLKANSIVALNDSDILAFSVDGRGGNITLTTPAFLGYVPTTDANPATLKGNNRVDINASGVASGTITLPDVDFVQNSLTKLPENPVELDTRLANSCIARSQQSSFIITGSGGLPPQPSDAVNSPYPTGTVRPIPSDTQLGNDTSGSKLTQGRQKSDPIVEAEGIYRLADGRLILSRECS